MALMAGTFFSGVLLSQIYSSYTHNQQKKLDQLLERIQGEKSKYEKSLAKCQKLEKWKYRAWVVEKIFWTAIVFSSFVFYKSNSAFHLAFVVYGYYTLTGVSATLIALNQFGSYLSAKHSNCEKLTAKLK